ncbi:MAG TPA: MerR family DNA-binding transcriptional regulator [Acetobacteraceae bacterium]|jgi:DNA-binding transcriptional MerR regulator|nr:MerR family DNA-binding transcriptional regulator [Acetobacteraceae bacterium]
MEHLYTVTELAADLGITPRTMRFYEDKGLISPRRAGTTRVYTARDRGRMVLILRGKRLGFSLRDIGEYLDLYDADPTRREQTCMLLGKLDRRIEDLEQQRRAVEQSLGELRNIRAQAEAALSATALPSRTAARATGA